MKTQEFFGQNTKGGNIVVNSSLPCFWSDTCSDKFHFTYWGILNLINRFYIDIRHTVMKLKKKRPNQFVLLIF